MTTRKKIAISRYRMTRHCLMDVIDIVRKDVSHETKRSHVLTPEEQTFAALRYYATGSFQQVIGDILGLSQPSVSRAVKNVSNALASFAGQIIQFPTDCRKLQTVKEGFMEKFGFPNVIGCVDGSFIPIKAPPSREDVYVCRKGFHALNVQGICDSQKKFTNLLDKFPGSAHDAFIWSQCGVQTFLTRNTQVGFLLGDQAYPLRPYLLTPLRDPRNPAEEAYNRQHQKTRKVIEDTFGRWKCRWLMLHKFARLHFT
ncbi:putative nuclease HARBI1 [Saccostrea cucullata]|uniref:putative nuclease HARBI1 n=1 Tax=Saccostrea cuccullata TaxID=36930 RepID=UPI002ED00CC6